MKKIIFLAKADEVKEGVPFPIWVDDQFFIAGRTGDRFWAIEGICPHSKTSMRKMPIVSRDCVICPYHGAQFDPFTGRFLGGPAGTSDIKTYRVLIDGGSLFLETDIDVEEDFPIRTGADAQGFALNY
jgi:nitrite reductase/ring-hydroxylating ferredoxin subunit